MESNLVSFTLWNYAPHNTNEHGDHWYGCWLWLSFTERHLAMLRLGSGTPICWSGICRNGEDFSLFSRDMPPLNVLASSGSSDSDAQYALRKTGAP